MATLTVPPSAASSAAVPVGPMLSMFDPVYLGVDEFGQPVYVVLAYRNMLVAGEPGGGKSGLIQNITAHCFLAAGTRPVLLDPKLVELGMWADLAEEFVGPDITHALTTLRRVQQVMNNRYAWLLAHNRRKITPDDGVSVIPVILDELAYYSATIGTKEQQAEFIALVRDIVARGRACAIPVIAATQRPSVDIIPTSLRDIFGFRVAFRCTTPNSSDIILGHGWAHSGFNAADIAPTSQGVAYLIAEGGVPALFKGAYLTDEQINTLVDHATWIRTTPTCEPATPEPATGPGPVLAA